MRICIDSCVFIHGLQASDGAAMALLDSIGPDVVLVIPRLVAQEVTRNLATTGQVQSFYHLFYEREFAHIVDTPVPRELVNKYVDLGLPAKADAFIGGFAEWMAVDYLISDNRHFLRELHDAAFTVMTAASFLDLLSKNGDECPSARLS